MSWTAAQQASLLIVIHRRNERAILQQQIERSKAELTIRQQEQAILRNQWQDEQADVDRLNRLSWASLFYDALNKKEQQISKEEAEAQQARLQYDVVCATVDDLQKQRADQENRLTQYTTVEADYEWLIKEKRITVSLSLGKAGTYYQQHLTELTQCNRGLQELDEAHQAGLQALEETLQLRELLEQARSWGAWDMLGGSALASSIKYNKLDDVRDQSYRVSRSLEAFRSEYADLNQAFMAEWQFDHNLTRFVDIFFDNIFTDWSVQTRINSALRTAQALENQLVSAIKLLKMNIDRSVDQTKQKAEELQRFLEQA